MIRLKKYQEEAVDDLIQKTFRLLMLPTGRQNLVFKAPTGAGKTIMMANFMSKLCHELEHRLDLNLNRRKACFIWIAPNQLYQQSHRALKKYFEETRLINPIFFESISGREILPNEVLFVNWQSINKESNLMIRENEQGKTLYEYIYQSRLKDREVIVIIDEEHLFASPSTAKRAAAVLQNISAKIEIRVSATPTTASDYVTKVERQDVVQEEMIKKGIILNPIPSEYEQEEGKTLDESLIRIALDKRQEIEEAYKSLGVPIKPLLLIQLPNDSSQEVTLDEKKYLDTILTYLNAQGISPENQNMAIWLSKQKENLDKIDDWDSPVQVLVFKQAIALGWDCPRASVLLIFREIKSTTFTIQTVGRILRMPEQKHYPNALLNQGYVYTNLSKDIIEVVKDDMNYISYEKSLRIESYQDIKLKSSYINQRITRNRLGSKFRKAFYDTAEAMWGVSRIIQAEGTSYIDHNRNLLEKRLIFLDCKKIEIAIPTDVYLTGEITTEVATDRMKFAKSEGELIQLFSHFCRGNLGGYAPADSAPVLELALKLFFEEYLDYFETDAIKIILYAQNQVHFIELIEKSRELYAKRMEEKAKNSQKKPESYIWEVPVERAYPEIYKKQEQVASHALMPFYEYQGASQPEKLFRDYLEQHKAHIPWWYKNGDKGKEHFAVPYTNAKGQESLFYIDFIVLLKDGRVALFDTKTKDSDPEAHLKHNALLDYIEKENQQRNQKLFGGVLIVMQDNNKNVHFRYCRNRIENTYEFKGWDYLKFGVE